LHGIASLSIYILAMYHVRRALYRLPQATLVLFAISSLLVLSFILFEVLDIDGSDLPVTDAWHWIASDTDAHGHRIPAALDALTLALTPWLGMRMAPEQAHQRRHLTENYSLSILIERQFPLGLPRATLPAC
jgi:hypothetical protein